MYEVGTTIGDMMINGSYKERGNLMLQCSCMICGKNKNIRARMIDKSPGMISHNSCIRERNGLATNHKRLHNIWACMKSRIYNPNNQDYHNYGGRGLKTEYDSFTHFYEDLHESYYEACEKLGEKNVSIDRIDNNIGYFKDNIRRTDSLTQARNRRILNNNLFYAFSPDGKLYISNNKKWFGKNHGISSPAICKVIDGTYSQVKGWTFSLANDPQLLLFTPQNVIEEFYY